MELVEEHSGEGFSLKFAEFFKVDYDQIPCLLIFDDVRKPEHLLVNLEGLDAEIINVKMRLIFSIIKQAVIQGKSPLLALQRNRFKNDFLQAGKTIISELQIVVGKSIEKAIEVLVKESLNKPGI